MKSKRKLISCLAKFRCKFISKPRNEVWAAFSERTYPKTSRGPHKIDVRAAFREALL